MLPKALLYAFCSISVLHQNVTLLVLDLELWYPRCESGAHQAVPYIRCRRASL
jgi:hypothetical protein